MITHANCAVGHETKAMLNNRGPRYKRSQLERRINRDVIWCVILLLFLCFFCAIGEPSTQSPSLQDIVPIILPPAFAIMGCAKSTHKGVN